MCVPVAKLEKKLVIVHVARTPSPIAAKAISDPSKRPTIAVSMIETIICDDNPATAGVAIRRILLEYSLLGSIDMERRTK